MRTIVLAVIVTLTACTVNAQSGQWSRTGSWHLAQSHRVVEFNGQLWAVGGAEMNSGGYTHDEVRSSSDGVSWTQEVDHAPFGPRANHGFVVFNNRLWVVGGSSSALFGLKNDVWSSADGVNWTLETGSAGWSPRASHATLVYNNRIWVMGGRAPAHSNDVWSSPDGVNWTQETVNASWPNRFEHAATVFMGRMWVFGGQSGSVGESNDVWSSTDGINWTLEVASAPWSARSAHTVVVQNGQLWLMGGGWSFENDVWCSSDGVNWTQAIKSAGWSGRRAHACAVFNNQLWVMGGFYETYSGQGSPAYWLLRRDVWSSADGVSWQRATSGSNWSPRFGSAAVSFNNRLWVVGGGMVDYGAEATSSWASIGLRLSSEVWSSLDGVDWTLETVAPFSPRMAHATVVHGGRMWVIGGDIGVGTNDVWSTSDGVNWIQNTASAAWSERSNLSAVVFNNRIWIMGGDFIGLENTEVWSTADGVNWRLETDQPGWTKRRAANVLSFNGRIWLIGGQQRLQTPTGSETVACKDVWSTVDGINWSQELSNAAFLERGFPSACVFDNRIWLTGGNWSQGLNDVWTTSDGVNWSSQPQATWAGRSDHCSTVHAGKLWVIGGGWYGDPFNDVWTFELDTPPAITSNPQPAVSVGSLYRYVVKVSGAPAPVITTGALPSWLTLTGSTLHGTPTAADIGTTTTITLTATNSFGTDDQQFQIDVIDGPVITSAPLVTAQVGAPYIYDIVSGGAPAPTFGATGLPGWLTLSGNRLSGTPSFADIGLTGSIVVTATNASGTDMQSFQIDVQGVPPQITSTPIYSVTARTAYSYTVSATGTPAPTLSATGL
ncbi:MAG: hypothetical protein KDB29_08920, partial [Planctomycetes bacterium]|nr:hypothetical protein [Planctomycetota bacterium]